MSSEEVEPIIDISNARILHNELPPKLFEKVVDICQKVLNDSKLEKDSAVKIVELLKENPVFDIG